MLVLKITKRACGLAMIVKQSDKDWLTNKSMTIIVSLLIEIQRQLYNFILSPPISRLIQLTGMLPENFSSSYLGSSPNTLPGATLT